MYHQPIRLLEETLLESAREDSSKVAVIEEGREHTYGELLAAARRLAGALRDRGVERGDRVAVYLENSFAQAAAIYAALLCDAVFLVVNPQTKSQKLQFILRDSGAKALISAGCLMSHVLSAVEGAPELGVVISTGELPPGRNGQRPRLEAFEEVMRSGRELDASPRHIPSDLAALIYTSGSTGDPKGVMMSHQAMVFAAGSIIQYLRLDRTDRILNLLPLAFDYGLYQLLMSVYLGATLVLERSFVYPAHILNRIREAGVTVFPGVPTIFTMLVSMHRRAALSLPSVLRVTNTAAALPSQYTRELHEIFPNALVYRMYGLTECKRVCYLPPELADAKPNSVGRAIPGTEVFLLSEEGDPVGQGEPGILHVRGPHLMMGYWGRPDLSAEMLKDGSLPGEKILCAQDWFITDADGDLTFLGRRDEIIKSRGEKVSPVEVENVLYSMAGVREAAVVGVDDPILGQAVKAIVVAEEGSCLTASAVLRHCAERLENFMVPKIVEFAESLPKTATGKIRKADLREGGARAR